MIAHRIVTGKSRDLAGGGVELQPIGQIHLVVETIADQKVVVAKQAGKIEGHTLALLDGAIKKIEPDPVRGTVELTIHDPQLQGHPGGGAGLVGSDKAKGKGLALIGRDLPGDHTSGRINHEQGGQPRCLG